MTEGVVTGRPVYPPRRPVVAALGPKWVANGRAEPFVAVALCVCLAALIALDLERPETRGIGNPTAIVVLIAVVAGWSLRARWAAPVWALSLVAVAAGLVTGDMPPLNAVAVAAGAVAAGIGGHAGSTAFRESLALLDRQATLIRRAAVLVSGRSSLPAVLDEVLLATEEVLDRVPDDGGAAAAMVALEQGRPGAVTAGRRPLPLPALGEPAGPEAAALVATALAGPQPSAVDASRRVAAARIDADGRAWGVLFAGRPAGARLSRRELDLLRAIAELTGGAVESRLRAAAAEQLGDGHRAMHELATDAGASPDAVAAAVLRRAAEALAADVVVLARVRAQDAELVAAHDRQRGPRPEPAGARCPAEAVQAMAPDAVPEPYRDALAGVQALLVVPLTAAGQDAGLLTLGRRERAPFTDDDRRTADQLGGVAALALLHAWTRDELERERRDAHETARQLRAAIEAGTGAAFETELDALTRRLLAQAAQSVGADRGSIGWIDGDQLVVQADWPDAGETRTARTMSVAGVPGLLEALRSGRLFQQATSGRGGEPDAARRHGLQYPLIAGGHLVGVLSLSRASDAPFDDAELQRLRQVTALTALTLRSARLVAQARGLGQAKSEFLNMAAHELRTPLAVVRGYLSMMADGTLAVPDTTRRHVVTLCQKTDELSAMVEQILTAAQIQAGGMQIRRHVFDLRDAIGDAIDGVRQQAGRSGVELWCEPLPEPIPVEAVRASVRRILDNLLGNAISYGNGLPVRLTVETIGPSVWVRVEDQGLGISRDQQARLFEPFFRVDQPSVRAHAGAGLGLAVSRRLAELSGGALELEWTQPGAGSTFVLRLPAAVESLEALGRPPVDQA